MNSNGFNSQKPILEETNDLKLLMPGQNNLSCSNLDSNRMESESSFYEQDATN